MTTRPLPGPAGSPHLTPQLARRLAVLGAVVLAALAVLLLRLWFLQVIGGAEFERQATDNRIRTVSVEAPRGVITDRNGKELVRNRAGENVVIRPQELPAAHRARVVAMLARALKTTPAAIEEKIDEAGQNSLQSVVIAEDVGPLEQAFVEERHRQLPGVGLEATYVREYPEKVGGVAVAGLLLGYTQQIPAEEAAAYRRKGYRLDEHVGIEGIEKRYEDYLRGTAGQFRYEVDATGEQTARGVISARPPRPGHSIRLSIDLATQRTLEDQLRERVALSGLSKAAAGVAIDPQTGQVLALASYPSYDPDAFARRQEKRIAAFWRDPRQPFFNRAIQGRYPPASTFKPITSVAALETGKLRPDELVASPGSIKLYGQPWKNFGGVDLGLLTVRQALMFSADTFFDEVATRFYEDYKARGRDLLQDWARRFGYGRPTGIDIPGEDAGVLPTPQWKRETFKDNPDPVSRIWLPGDTIQMAIGQKDLQVTPLQVAVAYAAIANGGRVVTPTIVNQVEQPDGTAVLTPWRGHAARSVGVSERTLGVVRDGLYMVANNYDGTAVGVFQTLPDDVKAAGKTGTAENSGADHSWFVGYAPYYKPRIVIAIVVENGGQGANAAAPAVCRVMGAYLRFDGASCGGGAKAN
ncbi:MAG: penicillin-binding protein 2 [Actinomycetota bacterium]